ncbi:MAG: phenylalanine--tRNA ligase subunit alpha [Deltaproteobacteria bacterium]|nr:phenylalanine--tRNA ligase subunit alpha [Deltaproteobacteria bacterium]
MSAGNGVREKLKKLEREALAELQAARGEAQVRSVSTKYIGRKGLLTHWLKEVGKLPAKERPILGQMANQLKATLEREAERAIEEERKRQKEEWLRLEQIDYSLPGRRPLRGSKHLITQVTEEIVSIFEGLGFEVSEGPEVELDYYNFEALNFPPDHPARDMQDTFYFSPNVVLRTHTSPVQVRTMERRNPPLRVIAPGRVYRHDSDPTHSPMFHQVEGFIVDQQITFADLKGTLTYFVHQFFGPEVQMRFRPSFFPFTEPSAEVDIQCVICRGEGCPVCKKSGWLEILGSGMIDPEVFRFVGYDPELYTGFAFGLGVERIAMLRVGLSDIRIFFENNLQFLKQF